MDLPEETLDEFFSKVLNDLSAGLLYTHTRINFNTTKTLDSISFLYALIQLLNEKGLLSIEEIEERKTLVAEQVVENFVKTGISVIYQDPEYDKYNYGQEIHMDCKSLHHICKSICCKLPHALSRQDIDEGILRWEFGRPYLIAHDTDGYCVHLNRSTLLCSVHSNRPVACRGFDCRNTDRWHIWQDFDKKLLNPQLIEQINETLKKLFTYSKV